MTAIRIEPTTSTIGFDEPKKAPSQVSSVAGAVLQNPPSALSRLIAARQTPSPQRQTPSPQSQTPSPQSTIERPATPRPEQQLLAPKPVRAGDKEASAACNYPFAQTTQVKFSCERVCLAPDSMAKLMRPLHEPSSQIQEVSFKGVSLSDPKAITPVKELLVATGCRIVRFCWISTPLEKTSAELLAQAIAQTPSMKQLLLCESLDPYTGHQIVQGLSKNKTLRAISLAANQLHDLDALDAASTPLGWNQLDLSRNQLQATISWRWLNRLSLRGLSLNHNPLFSDQQDPRPMFIVLANQTGLERLKLKDTDLTDRHMRVLAALVHRLPHLFELDVSNNPLTEAGVALARGLLETHPRLETVLVSKALKQESKTATTMR
jgi:hypothetical protein